MVDHQVQAAGAAQHKAKGKDRPAKKAVAKKVVPKTGTQVAVHQPVPPPAPVTLDQQIMLAAADPRVDVAKMRELTELRRQLRIEEAEEAFLHALTECQREMRPVEADANNPSSKSKYATLYAVDRALRPIYVKHGFSISYNTTDSPLPAHTRVLAYVSRGLFTRTYQYDVMNKTHAGGSALSYGKRYLLLMIFNVTIHRGQDRDDDGNAAGGDLPITQAQLQELIKLADDAGADKPKFCVVMNVDSMADIPQSRFAEAKQQLGRKLKKQRQQSDFPGDR
jgi:hypothetical protein